VTRLVVDVSVAIKWFLFEIHSEGARDLLAPAQELVAPDLIWPEFGNVLWKRRRRREISAEMSYQILADFGRLPLTIVPTDPFIPLALEIADRTDRTVYDALYLAVAEQMGCRMVTADKKLYNAVQSDAIAAHIMWIEDPV
jgi:predicted nucleic acid-binding protein